MNYKIIRNIIGWVLRIEAISMLLPLICALIYSEFDMASIFAVCALVCLGCGIICSIKQPSKKAMYAKEGFVTVAISWIVISLFGAIPFVISGYIPNFVDALFETVSGFTTTGASIMGDIEVFPKSLLFWRSFTHWIGGMGVLVFLVAILPLSGSNNLFLVKAESTGPSVSKLVPGVKASAKILYGLYIGMSALQIVLLLLGGMNLFESLTITFGTAGTGGFGIANSSAAGYSPYCQYVITIFMILFGVDFSIYYLLLIRKFKIVFESDELKGYLGVIAVSIVIIVFNCAELYASIGDAIRHSAFQVASVITTTGYSTIDYDKWHELSKTILVMLMFIGACAGSTGGGVKVSRIIILLKSIIKEIKIAVHPKTVMKVKMNGRIVEHETVRKVNVFMVSYLVIFVVSWLIVSVDDMGLETSFTAIAATLNNIGPGLAGVGPTQNFGGFSVLSKIVMIFDMLIGRLEIFPMLVLISPYTWKK